MPRRGLVTLAIALVACLVYANTLTNAFVLDDLRNIPDNPVLRDPAAVRTIFGSSYPRGEKPRTLYRPFTVWTLALNARANVLMQKPADDPVGFHVFNMLAHAAVGVLLFSWLIRLGMPDKVGAAAAALFVVHPIHTEAVDQVVGRAELLGAIFGLLLLVLHRQRRWPVLCAGAYLLALWSKESAVSFLAVAVAMDVFFRHPSKPWPWATYAACAATAAWWFYLRSSVLGAEPLFFPFQDNPMVSAPLLARLYTSASVQLSYLRLELVPVGLSADYSYNQIPVISRVSDPTVIGAIGVLVVAIAAIWKLRRSHPIVAFAVASYGILFAPTSNIAIPFGTIMAERLAYSPSLMISVSAAYGGWHALRRWPGVAAGLLAAIVLVFSALTVVRNRTWANEETLYTALLQSAPRSARAHFGMGVVLGLVKGDDRAAIAEYRTAVAIFPDDGDAFFNLGNSLRRAGADPEQVIDAYRHAIRAVPRHTGALANLARFLIDQDRADEALPLVARLADLEPDNPAWRITPPR